MKIKGLFLPLLFVSFFFLSSCLNIAPLSIGKIESVNIQNFENQSLTLKISLRVVNPNNLKFKIKDNNLDLFLNGKEIGTATVKEVVIINGKSEDVHNFILDASFSKVALAGIIGVSSLFNSKPLELKIKGEVKVKTLVFSKKYPIEITEKIDLKEIGKNFLN